MSTTMEVQPLEQTVLTARELEILGDLADGLTYNQIALKLGLSVSTIRTHLHNIYGKLGVSNRAQAVLAATSEGLLEFGIGKPSVEAILLARVSKLLEHISKQIEERVERIGLTMAQRRYLELFERYLHSDDASAAANRMEMIDQLKLVGEEAGREFVGYGARPTRHQRQVRRKAA